MLTNDEWFEKRIKIWTVRIGKQEKNITEFFNEPITIPPNDFPIYKKDSLDREGLETAGPFILKKRG